MALLTIQVTDAAELKLRSRAAQAGFENSAVFVAALIEAGAIDRLEEAAVGASGDAEFAQRLLARLHSGDSVPVTPEWFDEVRRRAGLPERQARS